MEDLVTEALNDPFILLIMKNLNTKDPFVIESKLNQFFEILDNKLDYSIEEALVIVLKSSTEKDFGNLISKDKILQLIINQLQTIDLIKLETGINNFFDAFETLLEKTMKTGQQISPELINRGVRYATLMLDHPDLIKLKGNILL